MANAPEHRAAPVPEEHDATRERPRSADEHPPRRGAASAADASREPDARAPERRQRRRRGQMERRISDRGNERRAETRRRGSRRSAATTDPAALAATPAVPRADAGAASPTDRRRERTIAEQREYWSQVRKRLRAADLEPFAGLLDQLAKAAFGAGATVVPHLRRSGGQRYLLFVVDAACPEACAQYERFLPLERAFWTAYATVPKPDAPFAVAIRPARGWCRAEALMPLFAHMPASEFPA